MRWKRLIPGHYLASHGMLDLGVSSLPRGYGKKKWLWTVRKYPGREIGGGYSNNLYGAKFAAEGFAKAHAPIDLMRGNLEDLEDIKNI